MMSKKGNDQKSFSQADELLQNDWPVLQSLRHKLKGLNQPLSGSFRQLFKQEKFLQQLEVIPRAMTVVGLEASDTLRHVVQPFTYSDEIIDTAESTARQIVGTPKKSADAKESGVAYASFSDDKLVYKNVEHKKITQSRNQSSAQSLSEETSQHKVRERNGFHGKDLSSDLPGEFLTPEYMQQWIDEILSLDLPNKKGGSDTHDIIRESNRNIKTGLSREHDKKKGKHSTTEAIVNKSRQKKSKVSFLHENKSRSHGVDQASMRVSSQERNEKYSLPTQTSHTIKQKTPSETSLNNAEKNTDAVFAGITLLQQLVQMEKPLSATHSVKGGKPVISELRQGLADNQHSLNNNAAWQHREKDLRLAAQDTQNNSDNREIMSSVTSVSGLQSSGSQQDADRIASLVNDVLVEQATRHGVDLS